MPHPVIHHHNGHFELKIPGVDTIGLFRECQGLEMELDVLEYPEGGNYEFVHKFPGRMRYPNLRLTRGLTDQTALTDWLAKSKTQPELKEVTITMLDHAGKPVRSWTFADAFPVRWTGPTFVADATTIAEESIEIAHSGLKAA